MIIEDAVILAIARPIKLKNGRISRCVIAYSEELKELIRLYPTYHLSKKISEGNMVRLMVIRGDSRDYSFKLINSKDMKKADDNIKIVKTLSKQEMSILIRSIEATTIYSLNKEHKSMGIVKPTNINITLEYDENCKLFKPYITYSCGQLCKNKGLHHQQLLDYNAYGKTRGLRPDKLRSLYNIDNVRFIPYLIVGNHHAHRNVFMVISIYSREYEA